MAEEMREEAKKTGNYWSKKQYKKVLQERTDARIAEESDTKKTAKTTRKGGKKN